MTLTQVMGLNAPVFTECEPVVPVVPEKPTSKWKAIFYETSPYAVKQTVDFPTELLPPMVETTLDAQFMRALEQVVSEAGSGHTCQIRYDDAAPAGGRFRYVYEGKGDCIVGRVLIKMGVPVEQVASHEGRGTDQVVRTIFGSRYPTDQVTRTAYLAAHAQVVNDSRMPWGAAPGAVARVAKALAS